MTREECRQFIIDKINLLGGCKMHDFVAYAGYHKVPEFAKIFHPDMVHQLILEGEILEVRYILPGKEPLSFLLPKTAKVSVVNA